ncbi:MAG: adenosine deaminase [bacterium]|nr:adenosine deaminase [bacterium]
MADTLRNLPKVQLHVHLEGTITPELFLSLARRHGVDLGRLKNRSADEVYHFTNFQEFLYLFRDVCQALAAPEDYGVLAAGYARAATEEGVHYAEVFVSPSVWTYFHRAIDVRAAMESIREALDAEQRRSGLVVKLIVDLTRNFGPARAHKTLAYARQMQDLGVIGIGLGGDEANVPAREFKGVFEEAREHGLHTVAHAGEAEAAWSVRDAVEIIGAERIGHGFTASHDPAVLELLAERQICVEVCPTSNELTGIWTKGSPHALLAFDRAGVPVAIDADDPALFGTTLLGEYERVAAMVGSEGVRRFARNAVAHSFADAQTKASLLERIDAYAGEDRLTANG